MPKVSCMKGQMHLISLWEIAENYGYRGSPKDQFFLLLFLILQIQKMYTQIFFEKFHFLLHLGNLLSSFYTNILLITYLCSFETNCEFSHEISRQKKSTK